MSDNTEFKVSANGHENRNGIGVTDLILKNMTDGKVLALVAMLDRGVTVLEKELAEQIFRALDHNGNTLRLR